MESPAYRTIISVCVSPRRFGMGGTRFYKRTPFTAITGNQGNHGEDVKEIYYYLDSTPTHSYMKCLYKYPQAEFPYAQLYGENRRRTRLDPEFELMDTGVFNEDRYFRYSNRVRQSQH